MPVTTNFDSYAVAHNKNGGGGGGNTYVMGGQNSSTYNSLNVHSINANLGNIDTLKSKSISANEASILYLQTREGSIQKLSGDLFDFNSGYVGSLASDSISTKQLKAEDIEAVNAFISTLQSKEITTEYLTVTKQAHFFELIIDKIRSVGGQLILTPASCIIDYVYGVTQNGTWVTPTEQNYNSLIAFDIFWRSTDDNGRNVTNDFIPGDQAICQSFNNVHTGTNYNISNKYYWRLVESVQDDDVWINLSTGAIAPSQSYATNNKYEIIMLNTTTKDETNSTTQDVYRGNGIMWQCEAQQIIGYQTNVSWTNNTLGYNQAINGIFETASMVYGIQITPSASNPILGITSRLEFYIKQIVDNSYIIPNKINIGVYFQDDTFKVFNDVALDGANGYVSLNLDNPETPIEAITIISTSDVNWHQCHTMRISNVTCDRMLDRYSSIPSAGDNLVQLGYRGQDNTDRQSAIIISAYNSPDPEVHAPSYAAYMGINDFNLGSHRGSYIDARGAKFIGDITMCSIDGQSISDTFDDLETKNKKVLVNTATIQVWPLEGSISGQVNRIDPSSINVTILTPGQNGMDLLNYVPEGYKVDFSFFSTNEGSHASQYDFSKTENESLLAISMPTGQYVGDINSVRIRLIKNEAGVPAQNAIVVDYVDIPYIQAIVPAVDGGRYEFRYTNFTPTTGHTTPAKPTEGSDGIGTYGTGANAATWDESVSDPDVDNNEFTYMTQCYCTANNEYGEWTDPIRITGGNGKNGEDGTDIEFIYAQKTAEWQNPTAPTVSDDSTIAQDDWPNVDGHTPSKTITKDGVSTTWTDNPQGVTEYYKFEYISMRTKQPGGSWSNYSTPVIWSNWGEKGQDGDGFEYIYYLQDSLTPPSNPTPNDWDSYNSNYQTHDEYVSFLSGWTDDPVSVTQNNRYLFVCKRQRSYDTQYSRVLWHPYSTPALWARYAEQGETGGHYEFRYTNFTPTTGHLTPTKPTQGSNGVGTYGTGADAATWGYMVSDPDIENNEFTYMTQCYVTPGIPSDTYGVWTDPVRITGGKGEPGADGTDIEFIYAKKATIWQNPTAPTVSDDPTIAQDDWPNVDGHTPSKTINGTTWTDNPVGVTSSERYEYMCVRYKYAGTSTWSAYSTPVIWSAFGDKGQDGDGFEYIYKLADSAPTEQLTPSNWYNSTSDYQTHDEYVSFLSGWTDDPLTPTSQTNKTKCWVAVRKRSYNTQYGRILWQPFSTPSMWSMYVSADGAEPGAPGENAQYNYLIPNREVLMAKIIDAYANNGNCDLLCDLGYNLVHVDGDTVTIINDWAGNGYSLYIEAFNYSYQKIWHTTDSDGVYTVSNLMATINNVAAKQDYMKCYENYKADCPIYLEVSLMKNGDILDKRCIPVQLETGALLKVQNDGIRSIVGDTENNTVTGWVNLYYSTKQQTATDISTAVTGIYNNFYTKDNTYNRSQIDQKDASITSTVESIRTNVYTKDETYNRTTIDQKDASITSTVESIRTNVYTKDETYNKSTIDQKDNAISLSVTNALDQTGIDITNKKIELRADKVTFTNSAGNISGKISIDPTNGTLKANSATLTGQLVIQQDGSGDGLKLDSNGNILRYNANVSGNWVPLYASRCVRYISSNTTLTDADDYIIAGNGTYNVYLPNHPYNGKIITIKNLRDGIFIYAQGSDRIVLDERYQAETSKDLDNYDRAELVYYNYRWYWNYMET